ncbi:hypothetical protein [Streptomyces sp. NPDC050264]|uniref:hypothetical protein n=1 Tax=Streptomyces sp. NPDC050264 TaxID=3155038 RepID=UPI00343D27E1
MFYGDPVAGFVSLALFGDVEIEEDEDFLTGYATGGGLALWNDSMTCATSRTAPTCT